MSTSHCARPARRRPNRRSVPGRSVPGRQVPDRLAAQIGLSQLIDRHGLRARCRRRAFLRETVDAHPTRAALGPARQSHSVAFRLSTKHLAGIITSRHDRSGGLGWLRLQLRRARTFRSAFFRRRVSRSGAADLALAHLADPPSCMRDRLLLFRRHRLIRISRKLLTHRATEYRRRRVEPHHRHDRLYDVDLRAGRRAAAASTRIRHPSGSRHDAARSPLAAAPRLRCRVGTRK